MLLLGKYDMDVNLSREEANEIRAEEQQRTKDDAMNRYYDHH